MKTTAVFAETASYELELVAFYVRSMRQTLATVFVVRRVARAKVNGAHRGREGLRMMLAEFEREIAANRLATRGFSGGRCVEDAGNDVFPVMKYRRALQSDRCLKAN